MARLHSRPQSCHTSGRNITRSVLRIPFTSNGWPHARRRVPRLNRATPEDDLKGADGGLSSIFNQFVFVKGITSPATAAQRSQPSPLMPPTAVLEHAMTLLQRNDWPEPDAGVQAAFHLTLPAPEGENVGAVRSWRAAEEWLPWQRFHALLHVAYGPMLNCDSWRVVSPLVFPSSRFDNKAVQAVEVTARARPPARVDNGQEGGEEAGLRSYTYTFCMERQESGSYKDCWLISGVRVGNYAL